MKVPERQSLLSQLQSNYVLCAVRFSILYLTSMSPVCSSTFSNPGIFLVGIWDLYQWYGEGRFPDTLLLHIR